MVACNDKKDKMFVIRGNIINGHPSKISLVTFDDTSRTTIVLDTFNIDKNGNFSLSTFNQEELKWRIPKQKQLC